MGSFVRQEAQVDPLPLLFQLLVTQQLDCIDLVDAVIVEAVTLLQRVQQWFEDVVQVPSLVGEIGVDMQLQRPFGDLQVREDPLGLLTPTAVLSGQRLVAVIHLVGRDTSG